MASREGDVLLAHLVALPAPPVAMRLSKLPYLLQAPQNQPEAAAKGSVAKCDVAVNVVPAPDDDPPLSSKSSSFSAILPRASASPRGSENGSYHGDDDQSGGPPGASSPRSARQHQRSTPCMLGLMEDEEAVDPVRRAVAQGDVMCAQMHPRTSLRGSKCSRASALWDARQARVSRRSSVAADQPRQLHLLQDSILSDNSRRLTSVRSSVQTRRGTLHGIQFASARSYDSGFLVKAMSEKSRASAEELMVNSFQWKSFLAMARNSLKKKVFQFGVLIALACALFLPDVWVLADISSDIGLDVLRTLVFCFFVLEFILQAIGITSYLGSFHCWTDFLLLVSFFLDLGYIANAIGLAPGNPLEPPLAAVRLAQTAKLGASLVRCSRIFIVLELAQSGYLSSTKKEHEDCGSAMCTGLRLLSSKLICALTACVAILAALLAFTVQTMQFHMQDRSMRSWLDILERTQARHPDDPARLQLQLKAFEDFYASMDYYPVRVETKVPLEPFPWTASASRGFPARDDNILRCESAFFMGDFNVEGPRRDHALANILMLILILMLMACCSLALFSVTTKIALRPLETMLVQVSEMASIVFESVTDMALAKELKTETEHASAPDIGEVFRSEMDLLDKVAQKFASLAASASSHSLEDPSSTKEDVRQRSSQQEPRGRQDRKRKFASSKAAMKDLLVIEAEQQKVAMAQRAMLESVGLSLDLVQSWKMNPLELDRSRNMAAAMYFINPEHHGCNLDWQAAGCFVEEVEMCYIRRNPYHNWFHAVDVAHATFRLLSLCSAQAFLSCFDRLAILASALAHDICHPGLSNAFLVETSHELALRYNDKSPLENMHCAVMFGLVYKPKSNILGSLERPQLVDVRKTCVEVILSTDMATQHFVLIKEVQVRCEMYKEIFGECRAAGQHENFPDESVAQCLQEPESRRLLCRLILHTADICQAMKPARICRIWANQVMQEFFLQGDRERHLGMQVSPLNDRSKVNVPFSQICFAEYLVAPWVVSVVKLLPPFEPLANTLLENVCEFWYKVWIKETTPPPNSEERQLCQARIAAMRDKLSGDIGSSEDDS